MSSKKWLVTFFATVALMAGAVVGLNYLADPFGVFPGRFLEWPGYEMTINPRAAKLTYLKTRSQEYDSYLIGCSSTSSYPVEKLNQYLDARFYNMIMYGADMLERHPLRHPPRPPLLCRSPGGHRGGPAAILQPLPPHGPPPRPGQAVRHGPGHLHHSGLRRV